MDCGLWTVDRTVLGSDFPPMKATVAVKCEVKYRSEVVRPTVGSPKR